MKKVLFTLFCLTVGMALCAYEVIVFGDVHYDSKEVRAPECKLKPYQEREMRRNLANWEKNIPSLLDRGAVKASDQTAFVVQLGDLSQGDCGRGELHEKSLKTALSFFLKRFPSHRVLLTPGNHDIRGKDAKQAYEKVIFPYLARTQQVQLAPGKPVQYTLSQEKDLFIFWDANNSDLEYLKKTIADHPGRRHLFILTHFPIIPVSWRSPEWSIYSRPDRPQLRKELISLLAKNNAIILCAHIHATTLARWKNEEGSIVQFSFFSIFPEEADTPKITARDLKAPFNFMANPCDPVIKQKKLKVIGDFLPGYQEIKDIQPKAGFAILKPSDKGVSLELYYTTGAEPTHVIPLR